ncbi:2-hydroxyacid dehydrogenase [Oceanibium sediminis]|uniref:2-hydroxyacid dehydrogenase n=1 Tax=Oceanibium sediminis TaxID=2026339 RepID=UPI000DD36EA8|nr:glyoxylate/hydroxypyruvate reductase A [Oceanibium sediminis]
MAVDVACLCGAYDLKEAYADSFAAHPEITLLRPDEVRDPARIRHALAFRPGPGAFAPFPNLELVLSGAAGVDGILSHPELPDQVQVTRMVDDGQARMMAAFALHFITGWHRRIWDYPARAAARDWSPVNMTPPEQFTVGLLGFGNMASTLSTTLRALGYQVCAWANRPRQVNGITVSSGAEGLRAVAGRADALVNLLPLTPATSGLLDANLFAQMKEGAMLIQLGRGEQLVEADLLTALASGRPAMAAIDVLAAEPPAPDNPLWDHPRVLLTPHVASMSDERAIARTVASAIAAFERGERPAGLVDRTRGY